jgi:glycosyltransferase involved in cell wall biosynthesis
MNTFTNKRIARIGIDARFYGPLGKGLGRYVQEITDKVIGIDEDSYYEFVVFLSQENYDEFLPSNFKNKNIKKVLCNFRWYGFKEQIIFPYLIWKEKLDLIHFPHFNVPLFVPTTFILTIHDLILTKFPSRRASTLMVFKYWFKHIIYRLVIKTALKKAKKIITVSNFTKEDLVKSFKVKADKIAVIYEGIANLNKSRDSLFIAKLNKEEVLFNYSISNRFLLYVGNAYPHKNLDFLLKTFSVIEKSHSDLKLVLVGKEDYFYERLKKYAFSLNLWQDNNRNSKVIFTGYVPDAQLKILYSQAFIYVFPSLYEGFGLPPLEAMANNCPVLSSNQASLPEILGESALYFNPREEKSLIENFKKLEANKNLRETYIKKGKDWIKRYDWWTCARKTFDVYENILRIIK